MEGKPIEQRNPAISYILNCEYNFPLEHAHTIPRGAEYFAWKQSNGSSRGISCCFLSEFQTFRRSGPCVIGMPQESAVWGSLKEPLYQSS